MLWLCIATLFPCRHWGHAVRTSQLKTTPSASTVYGNSLPLSCPHLAMLSLRGSVTVAFNQTRSTPSVSLLAATSVVNSQTQSLSVSHHLYTHRVLYWPGQASIKYMYAFLVIFFLWEHMYSLPRACNTLAACVLSTIMLCMNGFTHVGLIHCKCTCIRTLSQAAPVASLCNCGVKRFIESTLNNVLRSWGNEQPRVLSVVFYCYSFFTVHTCTCTCSNIMCYVQYMYLAATKMYGMKATTFCIYFSCMLFDEVSVAHNIVC